MSRCSIESDPEVLAGTAPHVGGWLIVEQPGPWGRDAIVDSRLPDPVRDLLLRRKNDGWGVLLARHASRRDPQERNVWTAEPGSPVRHGIVSSIDELTSAFLGALPIAPPQVFVCTHSGRDQCCAVLGRPLAQLLDAWECSHVGGHRFAPVALDLATGNVYGRITPDDIAAIQNGQVPVDALRGCSYEPAAVQAARLAVPGSTRVLDVSIDDSTAVVVLDDGGRSQRLHLELRPTGLIRRESCTGEPVGAQAWCVVTSEQA